MSSAPGSRPALCHEALFHAGEEALFSAAVGWVRQGVERGETALLNTGSHGVTQLLKAVFADEPRVVFLDPDLYLRPVAALEQYRRTVHRGLEEGVAPFRALGIVDLDAAGLPWQEWVRYEAAVNRVLADYPIRSLCPYDTTRLAPEVLEAMRRAHPRHLGPHGASEFAGYCGPDELAQRHPLPPDDTQAAPPDLVVDEVANLRSLRIDMYAVGMLTALPRERVDDFMAAVSEVVRNAWTHGAAPVAVRLWSTPEKLVCEVTDQGPGIDDPLQGYGRATLQPGGPAADDAALGIWAARQLCDVLDYRRSEDGFTVRLRTGPAG